LCQALAKAQEVEKQQENETVLVDGLAKMNFISPGVVQVPAPTFAGITFEECARLGCPRHDAPPFPPPRA
jgi:hypothetical protein